MKKDFLIFVVDEMSSTMFGRNGNTEVDTPNLDRLAKDGISFRRAYCNNTVCMPSRATMITGLTPRQHGCVTNGTALPETVPTITQALAVAGYRTHSVGKLHLQPFNAKKEEGLANDERPLSWESRHHWDNGDITKLPPNYYGFQTTDFVGGHIDYCFGDYANWLRQNHPDSNDLYQRGKSYHDELAVPSCWRLSIPEELHYNTWITDRSISFLDSLGTNDNFFLWCSFPDPHFPFAACQPYSDMYDPDSVDIKTTWGEREDLCECLADLRNNSSSPEFNEPQIREIVVQTYGMITHIDRCVGRILDHLESINRYNDTVVVFMSDHGEYLGAHHLVYKGGWPYEELLNVPFVWKGTGSTRQTDAFCDTNVSLLDFAPTILEYAGIDPFILDMRKITSEDRRILPGHSLHGFIEGDAPPPSHSVLIEVDEDIGSFFQSRTIIKGNFKLGVFPSYDKGILIDLEKYPDENINLWDYPEYADIKNELTLELLRLVAKSDRMDQPRLSYA